MKRSFILLIISSLAILSCENYDFEVPTCELSTPPSHVIPYDWEIEQEEYFRFEVNGVTYSYRANSLESTTRAGCPNDPSLCGNQITTLGFDNSFEFSFVHPIHEDTWIASTGVQMDFLNMQELMSLSTPAGQAGFTLFDGCTRTLEANANDPLDYQHILNSVEVVEQIEGRNNAGNDMIYNEIQIEGQFQGTFNINGSPTVVRGDYRIGTWLSRRK